MDGLLNDFMDDFMDDFMVGSRHYRSEIVHDDYELYVLLASIRFLADVDVCGRGRQDRKQLPKTQKLTRTQAPDA